MKKLFNSKGYTLIELLSVAAILVVITTIIAAVITTTLRSTARTRITSAAAQNGNYALSIISNIIISSTDVTSIGGSPITDCTGEPAGDSITLSRIDGGSTTLACQGSPYTISSNSASLIDTSLIQVESGTCSFQCSQPSGDQYSPPIIQVSFTLTDKGTKSSFENKISSDFNTSVTMRSFSP